MSITNGSQIINNSVTGGNGTGTGNVFGGDASGGGIYTSVSVLITDSAVNSNTITGGASQNYFAGSGAGGGIWSSAAVSITNSTVNSNTIVGGNSQTSTGSSAQGGGIYSSGAVTVESSIIRSNTVTSGGSVGSGASGFASGGGIHGTAAMTINNTDIGLNTVAAGNTNTNGSGTQGGGIDAQGSGSMTTITNSRIKSNALNGVRGTSVGGGIFSRANMTITGSEVSNNSATDLREYGFGAGINNDGTMTITDSTIAGNTGLNGGGIGNGGTLNLLRSTISGNTSNGRGDSSGGVDSSGTVNATNSTFSNNLTPHCADAGAAGECGGAFWSQGTLNLTNSTLTNNQTTGVNSAGGIFRYNGTVNVKNTIVGGNAAAFPDLFHRAAGITGSGFVSQGYNLIGNVGAVTTFTQTGDQTGTSATPLDPMLGALANNGGPTMTHLPLAGSALIDKGAAATDPITSTAITTDQARMFRPIDDATVPNAPGGNASDIGAVEVQLYFSLTVTKAADSNDGVCDADCSLREAVASAGVDGALDTIVFNIMANSPGCVGTDCTIVLSSSLTPAADAGRPTVIDGNAGPNTVTLSGNNATQLLNLSGGANLAANNLNFTGGNGSAVQLDNGGTLTLTNCALFGNIANSGGAFFLNTGSVLNLTNVTISNNSTTSFGSGGGIWNAGGAVTAINTTITNNTARNHGGVATFNGGTFTARNTIIAANTAIVNPDAFGSFTSLGNNIMGNPTGNSGFTGPGDQVGTGGAPLDPRVIPIGFYGGKTLTQGLVNSGTASTAINAGSSSGAPASDERGASRIGAVDIGAFEVNNTANSGTFVAALPVATINTSYSARITANNGAFSYAVTTGAPPNGVTLNTNAGVVAVSGTPTQSGTFGFTITATSGANSSAINYTITVSGGPSPTPTATNTATATATATATPTVPAVITGTVTYGNAVSGPTQPRFVSNVLVSGAGLANVSTTTAGPGASAGQYMLTGFGSGSYSVEPTKTGAQNGAITSFDAAKIAQHVAGTSLLTGSQLLVADVSNNGTISSFDAGEIANYVVTALPAGITGNWKFSPANRSYASVTGSVTGEDYSALLMGEVSGNWNNTGGRPVSSRQLAAAGDGVTDSSRGPERSTVVTAPSVSTRAEGEVIIPVGIEGLDDKGIIAYEFDLRYDPAVIQPQSDPVDVTGTLSSKLLVAVGADEPGLLRVAVYGADPIDGSGVLLNLRFVAIGFPGSVSPLTWERLLLNEHDTIATDGQVELSAAGPTQAEVSGRLLTAMGQGVSNARVLLTSTTGETRSILSNGFGVYRFGGLQVGHTYAISVESKRLTFMPLTIGVTGQVVSVDMIAEQ